MRLPAEVEGNLILVAIVYRRGNILRSNFQKLIASPLCVRLYILREHTYATYASSLSNDRAASFFKQNLYDQQILQRVK